MKRLLLIAFSASLLCGCVSAGIATQAQSEETYSLAATAALVFVESGKASADAIKNTCLGDNAAYAILTATRTPVDGATYTASDNAHKSLQAVCPTPPTNA